MANEIEWKELENKTYEILAIHKDASGYINRKVVYRFWEAGDGDWKIHTIDSTDGEVSTPAVFLPKRVIDVIIRVTVKGDLKK
jgi:hypothetical protein